MLIWAKARWHSITQRRPEPTANSPDVISVEGHVARCPFPSLVKHMTANQFHPNLKPDALKLLVVDEWNITIQFQIFNDLQLTQNLFTFQIQRIKKNQMVLMLACLWRLEREPFYSDFLILPLWIKNVSISNKLCVISW